MGFKNLCDFRLILQKLLIFSQTFLDFGMDTIEKKGIINLISYITWSSQRTTVLVRRDLSFLGKERMQNFIHFFIVFC